MFSKKIVILIFLFVSFSSINAQNFELGKVSIAELQEKMHPKDTAAVAAILFKTGKIYTGQYSTTTKVKVRIKIYKKEGYKWANQEVVHYKGESVVFSDAVTYNLVNGKIEKTKLQSDGQFGETINKYLFRKKMTMPNVKEGSVLEFQYEIRSQGYESPKEWFFQTSIPVNYSKFETTLSDYLVYKTNMKGYIYPKVTKEKKMNMEVLTTYLLEDVPAIKEEAYVNNIDNYTSSISHELTSVNFPGQLYKEFSTDWNAVVKTIYNYDAFGAELNKTGYFEDDLKGVIAGLTTQDEKINAILDYVKKTVKWNDYDGVSCDDGVRKAYKDKTGNVAEINLMLTAMLRYAGISANPVLLSTRSNGVTILPNLNAFDYVIAAVEIPDGLILLDATEKYSQPNVLPLRDLNWFGRLVRKDGTSTSVSLNPKTLSKEVVNMSVVVADNGAITGKIRRQLSDQEALAFRLKNVTTTKEVYLEELEETSNNIEVDNYVRENELDLTKPIVETFTFKDTKDFENIKNELYVSPLLFLNAKENPFKQEIREYPVDFGYPTQDKYNIIIEIPDGYALKSMPESIHISAGEAIGSFKFIIVNNGNRIQIQVIKEINAAIVSVDDYPVLKDFYQKMIDKQNEKIILTKI